MKSVKTRIEKALQLTGSDQVWALIRIWRRFSFAEMTDISRVHPDTIRGYLRALVQSGHLSVNEGFYRLERDVGVDRPRVREDGSDVPQTGRQKAWTAMKIAKTFSVRDLHITCGIALSDAKDYINGLHHAGILAVVEASRPGVMAKYTLPRQANTGSKAPSLRRDGSVLDPNTGKVHPRLTGGRS
ncbi:MAG: hypothetical protein HQL86_02065 [Magnetococcales bacterium]|nr:hypothetical protein [Magnetococcales bacterium]